MQRTKAGADVLESALFDERSERMVEHTVGLVGCIRRRSERLLVL